jgi:hypothetical protein
VAAGVASIEAPTILQSDSVVLDVAVAQASVLTPTGHRDPGVRSYLAFWIGGALNPRFVVPGPAASQAVAYDPLVVQGGADATQLAVALAVAYNVTTVGGTSNPARAHPYIPWHVGAYTTEAGFRQLAIGAGVAQAYDAAVTVTTTVVPDTALASAAVLDPTLVARLRVVLASCTATAAIVAPQVNQGPPPNQTVTADIAIGVGVASLVTARAPLRRRGIQPFSGDAIRESEALQSYVLDEEPDVPN